jgi:hypothetical protein
MSREKYTSPILSVSIWSLWIMGEGAIAQRIRPSFIDFARVNASWKAPGWLAILSWRIDCGPDYGGSKGSKSF